MKHHQDAHVINLALFAAILKLDNLYIRAWGIRRDWFRRNI